MAEVGGLGVRRRGLLVLVAIALVAAACGSGEESVVRSAAVVTEAQGVPTKPTAPTDTIAPDDPDGSPVPTLFPEANPGHPDAGIVTAAAKADDSGALSLWSWSYESAAGPSVLVWNFNLEDGLVPCRNCAYLATRLRNLIAEVLLHPSSYALDEVVGFDPARTTPGDYAGNGWQVEFVYGTDADGLDASADLAEWLLDCTDGSCRGELLDFSHVLWRNRLYASTGCGEDFGYLAPYEVYPGYVQGTSDAGDRDAGFDRVIVASPAYRPVWEDRNGAQVLTGYLETGCGG